jgi:purine-nucleoside phosphorylase
MSTVPETIAANHCGMKVLAFAVVTNMATGIQKVKHDHHRVVDMANKAAEKLEVLVLQLMEKLNA